MQLPFLRVLRLRVGDLRCQVRDEERKLTKELISRERGEMGMLGKNSGKEEKENVIYSVRVKFGKTITRNNRLLAHLNRVRTLEKTGKANRSPSVQQGDRWRAQRS